MTIQIINKKYCFLLYNENVLLQVKHLSTAVSLTHTGNFISNNNNNNNNNKYILHSLDHF